MRHRRHSAFRNLVLAVLIVLPPATTAGLGCSTGDDDDLAAPTPDSGGDGNISTEASPNDSFSPPTKDGPSTTSDAFASNDAATADADAEASGDAGGSVLQYQNGSRRDGRYVEPTFTHAVVAKMAVDPTFNVAVNGPVLAQPLFIEPGPNGKPTLIVVTDTNTIYAIDTNDGSTLWSRVMGVPATETSGGCGYSPIGITGTPAIDFDLRTIYLDTAIGGGGVTENVVTTHLIHALSVDDGSERTGWPLDTTTIKSKDNVPFNASAQNQRGAALIHSGRVYFSYGAFQGDCGDYRGWVIGVPQNDPSAANAVAVPAIQAGRGAGIWSPAGPTTDGKDIFVSTGEGGDGTTTWRGSEAVLRLTNGPSYSGNTTDYFAPSNWVSLTTNDLDLAGSPAAPLDVPGATPSQLVAAFGKNGVAYLLDRANLGGIGVGDGGSGEGVASAQVSSGFIVGATASYTAGTGTYLVIRSNYGLNCPGNNVAGDLVGLKVSATNPPAISTAWCASNVGAGPPIVTTTDGSANPVVWTFGWYGPYLNLLAFDGETGTNLLYSSYTPDASAEVHHFMIPVPVHGMVFGAALNRIYKFISQ